MEPEGYKPVTKEKPTLVRRISNISRSYLAAMLPGLMGGNWSEENGGGDGPRAQREVINKEAGLTLTQKQKQTIRRTWKVYAVNLKENGIRLFLRFFTEHPAYRDLFPVLKDLDVDEVEASLFVRAHSLTVLHSIMSMVDNMDDKKRLPAILGRTARIHHGFGVRFVHFEDMLTLLLEDLAEVVSSEWDRSAHTAWVIFFNTMQVAVSEKMIEMEQTKMETDDENRAKFEI